MNRKILLVFPGLYGTHDVNMPLPLLYLSKPLLENGFEPIIFDCRLKKTRELPLNDDYICVGISTMSGRQVSEALNAARFIRAKRPDLKIIWGGPHPNSLPVQTAQSSFVDIVVRGEGEQTFLELAQRIVSNQSFDDVRGLAYILNGILKITPDREVIDIDTTIDLPYHLLDMHQYPNVRDKFELLTSKGCPHDCGFCSNEINYGRKWRGKTPEKVIEEMDHIIKKFNPKKFVIIDGNFFVNRVRVEKICRGIIEKGWNLEIYAMIRADYAARYDDNFYGLLVQAGFKELAFGAESGSDRILEIIGKGSKVQHTLDTIRIFKRFNLRPVISFMMGFPTETRGELNQTIDLYDKIMEIDTNAFVNGIFIFTPFPNAPLSDLVEKEYGYTPPQSLEEWGRWHWSNKSNISWVDTKTSQQYEAMYAISRFFFIKKMISSWNLRQLKVRCGSYPIALAVILFNTGFFIFAWLRWKSRFFRYPWEWKVWFFFYSRFKGID